MERLVSDLRALFAALSLVVRVLEIIPLRKTVRKKYKRSSSPAEEAKPS
jgi:hypothetical protein